MRIYGKTFQDIWSDMALPARAIVVIGFAFLVFSFLYLGIRATNTLFLHNPQKGALDIRGGTAAELLDPSLASGGDDEETAVLAYTGIGGDGSIRINLAFSAPPCERFRAGPTVFESRTETLLAPDGVGTLAEGELRYETPAIVYDGADPNAPWKLFAYRYFWMGDAAFAQRYGIIVLRHATRPQGPWSREEWILATAPDHPPPPYQGLVRGFIRPQSPELAGLTGFSRPSVVAAGDSLLMSLTAFRGATEIDRVILLVSGNRGRDWRYLGTLLRHDDLARIEPKVTGLSGASLLRRGSTLYLAAVFRTADTQGAGTALFRVADIATARLDRNRADAPVVHQWLPRQSVTPTDLGGGFAAYDPVCRLPGIVTSEHSGLRGRYQLFQTTEHPRP